MKPIAGKLPNYEQCIESIINITLESKIHRHNPGVWSVKSSAGIGYVKYLEVISDKRVKPKKDERIKIISIMR